LKQPIDVYPWRGGWNGCCSKTSNTGTPGGVDENISLDEHEGMIQMQTGEGPHNLKVPMNNTEAVDVLHGARYFQQLISRY